VGALIGRSCTGWLVTALTPIPFMVATVLLAGLSAASLAFIDARTELALFAMSLAFGGFFRSLHATGLNAMAYAETGDEKAGAATSFAGTIQQAGMAIGVAFAVILVDVMRSSRGAALTHADFAIAFILSGTLGAAAAVLYPHLPQAAVDGLIGKTSSSAVGKSR
jgi:predicted MFS family arabinose efflux permease